MDCYGRGVYARGKSCGESDGVEAAVDTIRLLRALYDDGRGVGVCGRENLGKVVENFGVWKG